MINLKSEILIFTDGAARGNPGPGGFAAIIIFPESNDNRGTLDVVRYTLHELGGREAHTTNNRMELTAAIEALSFLHTLHVTRYELQVFSDSSYLVNGITKWVWGWQENGWKTKTKQPVENRDLWESLIKVSAGKKIAWKLVGGHVGVAGNERCDEIATGFADGIKPKLYSGTLEKYPIKNILDIKVGAGKKAMKFGGRSRSSTKAYSYVSLVGGAIKIHKTWEECEKRVKGKSGAKFKKVFSAQEETALTREWS